MQVTPHSPTRTARLERTRDRIWRSVSMRLAGLTLVATALLVTAWAVWRPDVRITPETFLPLHTGLQIAMIVIAALIYFLARTGGAAQRGSSQALLGLGFLGVAVLDFLHAMSFPGMPGLLFAPSLDRAFGFWTAARFLAAATLVAVIVMSADAAMPVSRRRLLGLGVVGFVAVVTGIVLLTAPGGGGAQHLVWHGIGLVAALLVVGLCALAVGLAYRRLDRSHWHGDTIASCDPAALMAAACVMGLGAGVQTLAGAPSSLFNLAAHVHALIAASLVYQGLVSVHLRDLEARFGLALDAGRIGVWAWAEGADAVQVDARTREIIGLAPDGRVQVRDIQNAVHAEDRGARLQAWRQALVPAGPGRYAAEYRVVRPSDGRIIWVASSGQSEVVEDRVVRMVGIIRDNTERRQAEEAVRQSQARLAGILAIAADAIIAIDADQRITLFNDGAEAIFGYRRDEILGGALDRLIPDRYRGSHAAHVLEFGNAPEVARRMGERGEIFARRKDGSEFPAEASISKLDIGGQRTFTVVLRDVTRRKRDQDLLARSHADLEQRVAERTQALREEIKRREETQAQLVRTQRMEAFGQLTGGVAHDFNNLLTVITGNLELLEMRLEGERERGFLKRAQEAAEMGARLTSRLLTFARRRRFEIAPLNFNDQIMGMVDLLRRALGEQIDLTTRLSPGLGTVRADPSEIENAVLNLAINARDAMPRGGRLIIETSNVAALPDEIGNIAQPAAGAYVRLAVTDTGSGMAPEVLQRAFEPFFTTKPPGKGTGLGLSSIYGFAQQLGGMATISSAPDKGTTVTIYLPRSDAEPAASADAAGETAVPGAGETVLLVEDNAEVREVTRRRLEELGYIVEEAENGAAALARFASRPAYDVLLSDVVMAGGMSGFDVARWVRRERPATRILLTSGYVDAALREQEADLADVRILAKPYSRAELARALRAVLRA